MPGCHVQIKTCCLILALGFLSCIGCSWLGSKERPELSHSERPKVAILQFGMGVEITKLSSVRDIDDELSEQEELVFIADAVKQIVSGARQLLYERLESAGQFSLVPLEEVDLVLGSLEIDPLKSLTPDQIERLRNELHVDILVGGIVQDYGKVRWQWLAAGILTDTTAETIVIGLATAWNPAAIAANVGFNLLTSTPVWFGGGYLFGVAFRPVRVEAWAVDGQSGKQIWDGVEVAVYARERLKQLSEKERVKKEAQLYVNLKKTMEDLGDSLSDAGFTMSALEERRRP